MRKKLGELLKVEHGYAFDSSKYVDDGEYRLVTLANFNEGNNSFAKKDDKAKYTNEVPESRFILGKDDLVLPLTEQVIGLFGNSAFVPEASNFRYVLNQRVGKITNLSKDIDLNYLHYLLATNSVKKQLEDRASGTKQRNISPNDVYDVLVNIPEKEKQEKIGIFLRNIENRIEINNRINDNLCY